MKAIGYLTRGLVALTLLVSGCKDDAAAGAESGFEDMTIVVEADKSRIMQEEQSLQHKRATFEKERERLQTERADIDQKLASLSKKDKRQRDELEQQARKLAEEEKRVRERANTFDSEREKLEADKSKLLERISKMTATRGGLTIEQREQGIAAREKDVAAREKAVAEREKGVAAREAEAGKRLEDTARVIADLQAGGVTKTVVVSTPAPASSASAAPQSKASVDKLKKQVRARMDQKGVLVDDLPPAAKSLWQGGNKALDDKDYGSAYEAFSDLERALDAIVVNKDFVSGKMTRINSGKKASNPDTQAKITALLNEVSDAFNEGRFDRANKKINQIVALLGDK